MTDSERSDAHVPSVTVSASPSEHNSPSVFLRFGFVCFLRAGGLGMYNTSPGRVRDGSFSPLGVGVKTAMNSTNGNATSVLQQEQQQQQQSRHQKPRQKKETRRTRRGRREQ